MCSHWMLVFSTTLGLYVKQADFCDLFYKTICYSVKISHLKLISEFIFIHKQLVLNYQLVLKNNMFWLNKSPVVLILNLHKNLWVWQHLFKQIGLWKPKGFSDYE